MLELERVNHRWEVKTLTITITATEGQDHENQTYHF